ncbi:MAG: hypothetical protein IT258_15340 [Saprospiraceae bacterium]|nr:hypothetical protein [Saprospiraceae bacterium]
MTRIKEPLQTIKELASYLLDPYIEPMHEQSIIERIHEIFSEMALVSGFDGEDAWHQDVQASSGMAISVNEAARCLLDFHRTTQFFKGMHTAILEAQYKFPGETIQVLYAGCGPYAPFLTMVAPLFTPAEVQFTLLEINDESLLTARKLVSELGLQPYLREGYLSDATLFQVPSAMDYHLLFTETMDTALEREPMVSILLNLLPQLRPDVLLIPRNVTVEAVFFKESDLSKGMDGLWELDCQDEGHSLGTVLDMAEAIQEYLALPQPAGKLFHEVQYPMPEPAQRDYFALFTTVEVWEGIFLYKNESDITDLRVRKLDDLPPCDYVNFEYLLVEEPELKFGVS